MRRRADNALLVMALDSPPPRRPSLFTLPHLLSVVDSTVKVLKLLGKEESRDRRGEVLCDSLGGSVGAVGGSEGVVDEHVVRGGELLDELGLILGLLLVEAGVLEEDNIAIGGRSGHVGDSISDAVRGELDLLSEELTHPGGARGKGELRERRERR